MRKALSRTSILWIVVALSLLVQALLAMGVHVPLVERSGAWRMATQPWTIGALAAVAAATMLGLLYGPGPTERRARAIVWALRALSIASFIALSPGIGILLMGTSHSVYSGYVSEPRSAPRRKVTPGEAWRRWRSGETIRP